MSISKLSPSHLLILKHWLCTKSLLKGLRHRSFVTLYTWFIVIVTLSHSTGSPLRVVSYQIHLCVLHSDKLCTLQPVNKYGRHGYVNECFLIFGQSKEKHMFWCQKYDVQNQQPSKGNISILLSLHIPAKESHTPKQARVPNVQQ